MKSELGHAFLAISPGAPFMTLSDLFGELKESLFDEGTFRFDVISVEAMNFEAWTDG